MLKQDVATSLKMKMCFKWNELNKITVNQLNNGGYNWNIQTKENDISGYNFCLSTSFVPFLTPQEKKSLIISDSIFLSSNSHELWKVNEMRTFYWITSALTLEEEPILDDLIQANQRVRVRQHRRKRERELECKKECMCVCVCVCEAGQSCFRLPCVRMLDVPA